MARALFTQEKWEQLASALGDMPNRPADLEFYYGVALGHLGKLEQAASVLRSGFNKAPSDKRFPVELAGIAFKLDQKNRARKYLHDALHLDPADSYANNFLATLYFLDGNIEAALKYWNRTGGPMLATVGSVPRPRLNPVLVDRMFIFAPGAVLTLHDYRATQQRVDLMDVFARYRFELSPESDGQFDLIFRNAERNGFGSSKVEALLNTFRRLPFQAITPEYYNLDRSGANIVSLYRFDAQKRRLFAEFSAPLHRDPKWRYAFNADLRKENWDVSRALVSSNGQTNPAQNFRLETLKSAASLTRILGSDWRWKSGVEVSSSRISQVNAEPGFASEFLRDGTSLKYVAEISGTPIRIPERRISTAATLHFSTGKFWSTPASNSFVTLTGGTRATYHPQASGDDYALTTQFRAGKTFGEVPLDEVFFLGIERDSDLWLRAHAGTRDGRKGSAPFGRGYVIFNSELDKSIYNGGFLRIKAGPFLDAGRAYDPFPVLGSAKSLVDAGVQVKFTILGSAGVTLSYGRGLRDDRSAFYATPLR